MRDTPAEHVGFRRRWCKRTQPRWSARAHQLRSPLHHGGSANPVSFVWDGDDLLNDYISGGVSVRYDVLEGEVLGHKGGANRYLYVPDPLGSVNYLLDTSQNIAGTYVYAPYGEVLSHTGANTPMQFVGALGYQTQIANRTYVRHRYYRPDLGRWVTRDPIGFEGGDWNLYGYAGASPAWRVDATGLMWIHFEGCNSDERSRIKQAVSELCGPAGRRYRKCLEEYACKAGHPGDPGEGRIADCIRGWCDNVRTSALRISCCGPYQPCRIFPCWGACAYAEPGREIVFCMWRFRDEGECDRLACVLAHELIHVCGVVGHGRVTQCVLDFDSRCRRAAR
jgi:RHS repeat-associated protein